MLNTGANPTEDGHDRLQIGRDVEEILDFDREYVGSQLTALDTALARCSLARNPEIHDLLSRIQMGEQKHADWIATQIDAISVRTPIHRS